MRHLATFLKPIATQATGFLRKKSQQATGVDLGSRFIKAVKLQGEISSPTLKSFAVESIGPTPDDPDFALEKNGQIAHILRNRLMPHLKNVGISVSGPQILLKIITLPVMAEKDIREHLSLELDRYIFLEAEEVVWDVYRHKASVNFNDEKQEHFLIVAKKKFINDRIYQFEHQGIKVHFVDVDPFALVNMVAYNYGKEETWLLVHLGPTGILSVIMETGKPVYIRQVAYEAEWYGGLLDRVLLARATSDEDSELGTSETVLLQQFFKETTDQVIESLRDFSELTEKSIMPSVLLSGGYSMVEGLEEYLADSLKMPVGLVNPFKRISVPQALQQDIDFQKVFPLLGVAVGVALRGVSSYD
jgi:type IV pilus assembly protein PilM